MNWNNLFKFVFLFVVISLVGCGQSKNNGAQLNVASNQTESALLNTNDNGELSYKKHCMSCHQKDAGGIPKMYPPLSKNSVISGDKDNLIKIVLNGMSGEIEVDGIKYNGVMASYRNLSDAEIASVLNYLRSNFGNEGEMITPAQVKALR
ncbi:c-type cytochrome [Carboxylicivirga caseinilyticus]|uniref:c-type cytochrome n=1 Tax=Carboxylicivirga caseinilyticus TaxID=3417572 RepID=UPI003D345FED|nr:cytochrome c [Marinilabiliaceae bacterium A049]